MKSNEEKEFLEWLKDNYSGEEYETELNHYVQSGEFPLQFMEEK